MGAKITKEESPDKTGARISGMFDAIAPRYDLLNRLLSAGIDRRWRAAAIRSLRLTGRETVLDVCTGTADVALEAVRPAVAPPGALSGGAARVLGIDFAGAMLVLGLRKVVAAGEARRIALARADAMSIPVGTATVDAVTVAFGIRNVERPEVACGEMARALRPGGRLAILEFGVPRFPGVRPVYLWYFKHVLPLIGRMISGHGGAYTYLPASVGAFPPPEEFMAMLRRAGFVDTQVMPLTFGIVHLYTATRP
jgi:demethylmenaquinone methyltransferase/2-methoxy-6-polyprenyl-1,4-benzoquinol methylase